LELVSEGKSSGSTSVDFNNLKTVLVPKEACFIVFRAKESFESGPWALVSFIPDEIPVSDRMVYSSSIARVKEVFGFDNFGEDRRFGDIDEVNWSNVRNTTTTTPTTTTTTSSSSSSSSSTTTSNTDKPWSARELATQELDKGEMQARKEYEQGKQAPGIHALNIPLTPEAEKALTDLKEKRVNWVQLSIDSEGKSMTVVVAKQVSPPLSSLVDPKEPQFYIYDRNGTIALIYACSDNSPVKHRMIYPTSKAALADKLKSMGMTSVKKLDIREPNELTDQALLDMERRSSSGVFKPDENVLRGKSSSSSNMNYSSTGGRQFNSNEFDKNKPVFNRPGFTASSSSGSGSGEYVSNSNIKSKTSKQGEAPSALRVLTGNNGQDKRKPKGIVIPPEGAYC